MPRSLRGSTNEDRLSITNHCLLAIEARSQRLGYAVFSKKRTLIDWGAHSFSYLEGPRFSAPLDVFSKSYRPHVIALSTVDDSANEREIFIFRRKFQPVPVQIVEKLDLRTHFARKGYRNKAEIAGLISEKFPELGWHFPRKRKLWQSESASQVVFDAVALGLFCLESEMQFGES